MFCVFVNFRRISWRPHLQVMQQGRDTLCRRVKSDSSVYSCVSWWPRAAGSRCQELCVLPTCPLSHCPEDFVQLRVVLAQPDGLCGLVSCLHFRDLHLCAPAHTCSHARYLTKPAPQHRYRSSLHSVPYQGWTWSVLLEVFAEHRYRSHAQPEGCFGFRQVQSVESYCIPCGCRHLSCAVPQLLAHPSCFPPVAHAGSPEGTHCHS